MQILVVIGFLLALVLMSFIPLFVRGRSKGSGEVSPPDRGLRRHRRNTRVLWGLILLAIAYWGLLRYLHTLTGIAMLDGSIGVALGLYICAHPAANGVNVLFFERDTLSRISEWSVVGWLALNLLVLLAGWMVVFIGLTRLIG